MGTAAKRFDRVAYLAVGALVLTITWNGIRVAGGGLANLFLLMAFAAVVAHVVLSRRPVPIPPWLFAASTGVLLTALVTMILPPPREVIGGSDLQFARQAEQVGVFGIAPARSNLATLIEVQVAMVIVPLLIAVMAVTRERCRQLMDVWTLGAGVCAAVAVLDYGGIHLAPVEILSGNRSSGLTIHPNYLALTCAMAIPTGLLWVGRSRRWTLAGAAAVPLLLGGIYASGSRAGVVAALLAVAATVALIPRLRRTVGFVLPLVGMLAVPLLLLTDTGQQVLEQVRLDDPLNTSGSDLERERAADLAVSQIQAQPVQGVGLSVIGDAHNIYLQLLSAGGMILLAAFLVFISGLVTVTRRAMRGPQRDAAIAGGIVLLVWLVNGIYDNQVVDKYLYVVPGLLLAMSRVAYVRSPAKTRSRRPAEAPQRTREAQPVVVSSSG